MLCLFILIKIMKTTLSKSEINHLLGLIQINEIEGCYSGNEKHYWKRSENIKLKLKKCLVITVQKAK